MNPNILVPFSIMNDFSNHSRSDMQVVCTLSARALSLIKYVNFFPYLFLKSGVLQILEFTFVAFSGFRLISATLFHSFFFSFNLYVSDKTCTLAPNVPCLRFSFIVVPLINLIKPLDDFSILSICRYFLV